MDAPIAAPQLRLEIPGIAPRTLRTADARAFQVAIKAELAQRGWYKWHAGGVAFEGAVEAELVFCYAPLQSWSERKKARTLWRTVSPEASDLAKLVLEALTGIAYRHPAQVVRLVVEKRIGPPHTTITIRMLV